MRLVALSDRLHAATCDLELPEPVAHVYCPLDYARAPHVRYLTRYGQQTPRQVLLVGMNPGPWGMGQTGVPFGAVELVRDWLEIDEPVGRPAGEHPKRPISGFHCHRNEVSGTRLWGWARDRFHTPERFFARFFVHNYCPLLLLEASGRNFTPDKLKASHRNQVYAPCDEALAELIDYFDPEFVIGVGAFAEKRLRRVVPRASARRVGRILHPSPASPIANRGWAERAERELRELGIPVR